MSARMTTDERRAEIVAATLRLASGTSPGAITTADVAAAVGITQGAIFKHFPTKDAIWLAAMRWVNETLQRALRTAADRAATPLAALEAIFHAHVNFVIAHPGVPRFIFHELQQADDSAAKREVRSVLKSYRRLLLQVLEQAVVHGQIPERVDREAAATSFVGLIQGLVMQAMLTGRSGTMRPQARRVFALYVRGLGVAP